MKDLPKTNDSPTNYERQKMKLTNKKFDFFS